MPPLIVSMRVAPPVAGAGHAARPPKLLFSERLRRMVRRPKHLLAIVFVPFLLVAGDVQGWSVTVPHLVCGVAGACVVDVLVGRWRRRAWFWPTGALLTGAIVSFVLGVETPWWITLALGALAAASKYLFRMRRGHIFNPAGLALAVSIPAFGAAHSWWGALSDAPLPWLLLLLGGGVLVVDRIDKFPLVLSYLGTYFGWFTLVETAEGTGGVGGAGLAGFAGPAQLAGVAEMFQAPFLHAVLFLAFFMVTDPPTSPGKYGEQVWLGVLVATVTCLAQLAGAGEAYLLLGLLAGNLALGVRWWLTAAGRPRRRWAPRGAGVTRRPLAAPPQ